MTRLATSCSNLAIVTNSIYSWKTRDASVQTNEPIETGTLIWTIASVGSRLAAFEYARRWWGDIDLRYGVRGMRDIAEVAVGTDYDEFMKIIELKSIAIAFQKAQ